MGVYYVSKNGMILVTEAGRGKNITEDWITRERWAELTPNKFIRAMKLAGSYLAYGSVSEGDTSVAQDGFTLEIAKDTESFGPFPHPGGHRIGFSDMTAPNDLDIVNVLVDPWSGTSMTIQDGNLYYYDYADQAPELMPWLWRSKVYQANMKKNYEVFRVWFSLPPGSPTLSASRDESATIPVLADDQYLIVRIYAGDDMNGLNLVTTREVRSSGELLRILSGFKYEYWQVEMEGRVRVDNLQLAPSVKELRSV